MQALLILTLTLALSVNGIQTIQNQRAVETALTSKLTNRPALKHGVRVCGMSSAVIGAVIAEEHKHN